MPIKIEVTLEKEICLGFANSFGDLQNAVYDALIAKAFELGIKCESKSIGKCQTLFKYPGLFTYYVDSSD